MGVEKRTANANGQEWSLQRRRIGEIPAERIGCFALDGCANLIEAHLKGPMRHIYLTGELFNAPRQHDGAAFQHAVIMLKRERLLFAAFVIDVPVSYTHLTLPTILSV